MTSHLYYTNYIVTKIKRLRTSCIFAISCALLVYLWIGNDEATELASYYNVIDNDGAENIPHHRQLDTPSISSLFHNHDITGGCQDQPAKEEEDDDFWSTVVTYHTEKELLAARPSNFLRLPSFDDGNKTIGGLALFRNAFLKGHDGGKTGPAIYDCANSMYVPGGCGPNVKSPYAFKDDRVSAKNHVALDDGDGVTIYLGQLFDNAYWHSQVEVLPKLMYLSPYLQQQNQNQNSITTILVSPEISKSRIDFLSNLLGLESGTSNNIHWVPFHDAQTYLISKLVVPTATKCGNAQPKAIEAFQQIVEERAPSLLEKEMNALKEEHHFQLLSPTSADDNNLAPQEQRPQRMVILVQQRLGTRKLLNHAELMSALRSRFQHEAAILVFQGNESPSQTAAIHHLASLVIAPHGAGLANLIYCRRYRTAVIEMHPPKGNVGSQKLVNHCHEATARAAGLRYTMMVSGNTGGFGDFEMNVEDVVGEVERALEWLRKGDAPPVYAQVYARPSLPKKSQGGGTTKYRRTFNRQAVLGDKHATQ